MKDKVTDYRHFLVTPKYYQWKDRILWKIKQNK